MKNLFILLIILTISCFSRNPNPFKKKVTIHLGIYFDKCDVKLYVNNNLIVSENISMEPNLSLSHTSYAYVSKFRRKLKFRISTCRCDNYYIILNAKSNFLINEYSGCKFEIESKNKPFSFW